MFKETSIKEHRDYPEISKFILSFIQALLKTGYYTPDHPETSKAKEGLYNNLMSILKGRREITFITTIIKEKKDALVDGIFEEPVAVSSFMLKGMAEMFVQKFLEYFDRKGLSSFSIKANISQNEFETFINIMSESPLQEKEKIDTGEQLTLELIKNSILHVSTIFNIDLVGRERELPWQVKIALARLKKDLSIIPLYKNLTPEQITELKNMVFDDIIRPIKSPAIIKDILVNLDIISPEIAGITREEFEQRVTDFIHKDYLILAAPEVLKFFIFAKESYEKLHDENILTRLTFIKNMTKKVGLKIIGYGFQNETTLMDYFNYEILDINELPENLHIKIKRQEEIERFLKEPTRYFTVLKTAKTHKEIRKIALLLLDFLPELLVRDLYSEAEDILKKINTTGFNFSDMDSMLLDEIVSIVEKKLPESTKEKQLRILNIIDLMDKISVVILMDFLTHESRFVRKIVCEMLVKHGKTVIPVLKNGLKKHEDWYFIRNALMILAEVGEDPEIFKTFLKHEEPRVRVEAIAGLINSIGADTEELLINTLKDKDPLVRRRAVWAMGKIKSTKPEGINYFIDAIKGELKEDESIIEQILSSMTLYSLKLDVTKQFEQVILETLSKGILSRFTASHTISDSVRAKMCETLGYIGSKKSIDLLKKLSRKDSQLIREKALEAIERIKHNNNP